MSSVTPLAAAHQCRLGLLGQVFVQVFDAPPNVQMLELIDQQHESHLAKLPNVASLTVMLSSKFDAPSAEFRAKTQRMQKRDEGRLLCSAIVITAGGLAGMAARGFLSAIQKVAPQKAPQDNFKDVRSAVEWIQKMAPQAAGTPDAVKLIEAFVNQK